MLAEDAPSSVISAYGGWYATFHAKDVVELPDDISKVGTTPRGDVWRATDGWGESYFLDPPRGEASWVCSKMPDVMAHDVADKFKTIMDGKRIKGLGMGDKAWDAAVLELF